MPIQLSTSAQGVLIPLKVVPGASRSRLMGEWNGRLKIAVAAAPERGQANAAVVELMAKALGLRRSQVEIVGGLTSPLKMVRVEGLGIDQIRGILAS